METDNLPEMDTKTKTSPWQLAGLLVIVFGLGLAAGYFIWARPLETKLAAANQALADAQIAANQQAAANAAAQQQPQQDVKRYDVPIDDDPISGPETAAITIIEFSDYECPFCQKWEVDVLPKLREKYGDQVRLVYRDYPLIGLHDNAAPAAEAANCAIDQGKYWQYHDLLFSGQRALGRETFEAYAQSLSLDMTAFKACLDDRRYQKEVEADYNYASELGVQSTPTFFINGLALIGAQPFEVFEQVIDMELAGKIP
jgi:protein-disulfide isomerase